MEDEEYEDDFEDEVDDEDIVYDEEDGEEAELLEDYRGVANLGFELRWKVLGFLPPEWIHQSKWI